ncbi:MAG TPA: hypothetical protein VJ915_04330 [Balneolaceae bacterium]|nr:hypothetical protein [Balneolaceae bacterium]
MKQLTKKEAIELMPFVVDNEASEQEKVAFFKYIQTDSEVKKNYESLLFVKQLLKTKYSRENAPEHLKDKITAIIEDMEWEKDQDSKVDNSSSYYGKDSTFDGGSYKESTQEKKSPLLKLLKPARYLVAASVIFIFSLLTIEFLDQMSSDRFYNQNSLEYVALNHFNTGSHLEASLASFNPESFDHASQLLEERMSYTPRLPKIEGADLRSIVHTTFTNGHNVPVLDFYQAGLDEAIHVFAFKVGEFDDPNMIPRDPEAVKSCKTYDDYHIKNINGKHVVSWKWGDYWYTAVSNHNGNDLIALVQPTGIPPGQESNGSSW